MQTIQTRRVESHPTHLDLFEKKIVYHNHNNFQIGDQVDLLKIRHLGLVLLQHNYDGALFEITKIYSNICETIIEVELECTETGYLTIIALT